MRRRVGSACSACLAMGVLVSAQAPERFAILNAKILDVVTGRLAAASAVVVEGAKITAVHEPGTPALPEGIRTIDAKGATLVPALSDLSVQVAATIDLDRDYFHALSLAHGVMRVRAVDGRLPMAIDDRARIAARDILAPQTWVAGPLIDMRRPLGQLSAPIFAGGLTPMQQVNDAADAGKVALSQAAAGVDWVRLGGHVAAPVTTAVVRAVRPGKVKVSAEARTASMLQLAQAGVTLIDGLGFPVKGQPELEVAWKGRPDPPADAASANDAAWAQVTAAELKSLVAALVRARTAVAPMLRAAEAQREDGPKDELDLVPDRSRGTVMGRVSKAAGKVAQDRRARARAQRFAFVKAFAAAGGTLVLASGAGSDGYPAPGLAIHKEMALLTEAGLSPADVWRAAVRDSAVLLGVAERSVRLRVGAPADFFLVQGDPLADPAAVSALTLIVRGGEILDRPVLIRQATRARGVVR